MWITLWISYKRGAVVILEYNKTQILEAWKKVLLKLNEKNVITAQQRGFLSLTQAEGLIGNTLLISVPNELTKEILEQKLNEKIITALKEIFEKNLTFAISIQTNIEQTITNPSENENIEIKAPPKKQAITPNKLSDAGRLNPKYNFENFVIGSSNRFAHAAAAAVAEAPAKAYNPLFIYGQSGLGKTHLLHAIGNYAKNLYPGIKVHYVNSEEFTNDFINSIRDDKAANFKETYRSVDILMIDDIQFLANKESTQEEFFHTFNALYNDNKQLVITSDLPPKRLSGFEERMRSRFEWGLITDVQPPDLETRIAILRKKTISENLDIPNDVLEYVASNISANIRELEGAMIRITAFASLNRQKVDLALSQIILKDLITDENAKEITSSVILGKTASYFQLSIEDLCGKSRSQKIVIARQIAMYLCRELTNMSLPKIGQQFGGRDHTTVMHADRKIRELMTERRNIFNQVIELTNLIKQQQKKE